MTSASQPECQAIWQPFSASRWFAGKGRNGQCVALRPLAWWGPTTRSEVATIAYPDGHTEHYHLLLSYRPEPESGSSLGVRVEGLGHVHDGLRDPAALREFVSAISASGSAPDQSWRCISVADWSADGELRVFGGEQSNTSVMVDSRIMVKLFRRLEPGRNLDIQVHAALNKVEVSSIARLHGWASATLAAEHGQPSLDTDLAMCVELLSNAHDGWPLAVQACQTGTDFTESARALGAALARVHAGLLEAYGPSTRDGAALCGAMNQRLDQALQIAPVLADYEQGLRRLFAPIAASTLATQRIHGDFHLGQTLATPDGWRVIDFEGEPMKSAAERAEPDSALRDVAGLLRSLDYATAGAPDRVAAKRWAASAGAGFLSGYTATIGAPVHPDVLRAYQADKAIYEVVYEVRNRPDWVAIPVGAVQSLTQGVPS